MKVLAVGDSFMPAHWFEQAFTRLDGHHDIRYLQVAKRPFQPATPSERSLREFEGDPAQLVEAMDGVEVLVVHGAPVPDRVLDASGVLRMVGCARGGPVNVDFRAASDRGIPIAVTPGKNADAVADLTLAFCVMLARRLSTATEFLQDGNALLDTFDGARFMGHDLRGLQLGLVGWGRVAQRVAARAAAFDLRVAVYDPYVEVPAGSTVRSASSLERLLADVDIVSLHARATSDNAGMVGEAECKTMKRGALFVNTARESLVDENALDVALESGHLGGAALDVVKPHSPGVRHPLLRHPNVVITPHIGGATVETLEEGAKMIAAEIERLAAGKPLLNVANPQVVR